MRHEHLVEYTRVRFAIRRILDIAGGESPVIDGRHETLTPASNCRKPAASQ